VTTRGDPEPSRDRLVRAPPAWPRRLRRRTRLEAQLEDVQTLESWIGTPPAEVGRSGPSGADHADTVRARELQRHLLVLAVRRAAQEVEARDLVLDRQRRDDRRDGVRSWILTVAQAISVGVLAIWAIGNAVDRSPDSRTAVVSAAAFAGVAVGAAGLRQLGRLRSRARERVVDSDGDADDGAPGVPSVDSTD
jgi:hypothetical protein